MEVLRDIVDNEGDEGLSDGLRQAVLRGGNRRDPTCQSSTTPDLGRPPEKRVWVHGHGRWRARPHIQILCATNMSNLCQVFLGSLRVWFGMESLWRYLSA